MTNPKPKYSALIKGFAGVDDHCPALAEHAFNDEDAAGELEEMLLYIEYLRHQLDVANLSYEEICPPDYLW